MLVRSDDLRMIIAELCMEGTSTVRPSDRPFFDALRSLEWDAASDEAGRVAAAIGRAVPAIQTLVWRPGDLVDGAILETLR
jgi:hypothetical protein